MGAFESLFPVLSGMGSQGHGGNTGSMPIASEPRMNHLSFGATTTLQHGLPSARALALMALRLDTRETRADLLADAAAKTDAAGPGWFESSFELGRGLSVLEGSTGLADEWMRLAGAGRAVFSGAAA